LRGLQIAGGDLQLERTRRLRYESKRVLAAQGGNVRAVKIPRDIPSPINFHDLAQARSWMERTAVSRPWRPEFFRAFSAALNSRTSHPLRILEVGSGPGQLASAVLKTCCVSQYVALDFSGAMHALAREQLGPLVTKVKFVKRDFRKPEWNAALGKFDAVVTLQAAHETRHQDRLPGLLARMRASLKCGGVLLYCDHYRGIAKNPLLYLERQQQPRTLRAAGFAHVERLLDKGGMALYRALA
jgi:SAM-dependent methyltransferase